MSGSWTKLRYIQCYAALGNTEMQRPSHNPATYDDTSPPTESQVIMGLLCSPKAAHLLAQPPPWLQSDRSVTGKAFGHFNLGTAPSHACVPSTRGSIMWQGSRRASPAGIGLRGGEGEHTLGAAVLQQAHRIVGLDLHQDGGLAGVRHPKAREVQLVQQHSRPHRLGIRLLWRPVRDAHM